MVKEKPNSIRTYDKDGFRRRAACLCFRDQKEEEVCNSVFKIFIIIIFIFIITPHVIMHMNTLYPPLKPLIIIRPFSQLTFFFHSLTLTVWKSNSITGVKSIIN